MNRFTENAHSVQRPLLIGHNSTVSNLSKRVLFSVICCCFPFFVYFYCPSSSLFLFGIAPITAGAINVCVVFLRFIHCFCVPPCKRSLLKG